MYSLSTFRDAFQAPILEEFDRLFNQMCSSDSLHSIRSKSRSCYPKLDVIETSQDYMVEVEVPGVNPDDLKVEIINASSSYGYLGDKKESTGERVLRLSGKKDYKYQYPDGTVWHVKELKRSMFVREVLIPKYAVGEPEAVYEKGILRLKWQKVTEVAKPDVKLIPIVEKV